MKRKPSFVDRVIEPVDRVLVALSAVTLIAIMLIVTTDVALRYVFSRPLIWAYDVIGLYLMAAVFFLALPHSLRHHVHICVDVIVHVIPRRVRHAFESIGYAATTVLLATLVWLTAERLVTAYVNDELVDSAVSLPAWIAQVPVAAGLAVLTVHCFLRFLAHLVSTFAASSLIEFPPQSGSGEAEA
ncbi:MAG: TRAP transporter small permease [Rhodospirillales bacterium]|nr:TRAP transporter small permease [Rhodospirillales bacterium]